MFFCPVTTDQAIYGRYAPTTKALPMVRLQDADGNILAEVVGKEIPSTGERLYDAIGVQVELRLPHLRHRRHHPQPMPPQKPQPQPPIIVHVDRPPQPLGDGGPPVIRVRHVVYLGLGVLCLVCLVVGLAMARRKPNAS